MNDTQANVTIKVFPNSGHQFFNISLEKLLPKKDREFCLTLALKNKGPWEQWSEFIPWILYKYEVTENEEPIIRLCIETNLGDSQRGLLFDVENDLVDEMPDEDEIIEPYACQDEAQIEEDYPMRLLPLDFLPDKNNRTIDTSLHIHWVKRGGFDPVDVDLVVDFGNTRTVALLLETPDPLNPADKNRRMQVLRFIPRGQPYDQTTSNSVLDEYSIVDSWLLLHRPQFYSLEPPYSNDKLSTHYSPEFNSQGDIDGYIEKQYLPHTFVEISPGLIGGGRSSEDSASRIFAMCDLNTDARFYLSSPKRYVWDKEQIGSKGSTFWKQIPNKDDPNIQPDFYDELGGLFRYFMDPSGNDRDIDNPPSEDNFDGLPFPSSRPSYPRRDAVCWFALSIIEAAHRQINSGAYLKEAGRESLPRRLRSIRVTYPAGWTHEESKSYLDQWQRAINLFTMTRFENHAPIIFNTERIGGSRPLLAQNLVDEAVCSQLPIIYSDIQTLCGSGSEWCDLYGDGEKVTVMNLDIGGGTTDMAIIQYRNEETGGNATKLKTKLLFRDGYAIAGDMLVKKIIEKVLIPSWIKSSGMDQYEGIPDGLLWISRFFSKPSHNEFSSVDSKAPLKLARIIRLIFVPLVNYWLQKLTESADNPEVGWEKLNIGDALERNIINAQVLKEMNDIISETIRRKASNGHHWDGNAFGSGKDVYVKCDRKTIESCVDEVFGELFDSLGELAGRFNCQLVVVSGKPSELPRIKERLRAAIPLMPQRIIHVKNFPAGDWYPFGSFSEGRIADAKTCTVVGAALYQDICNGNLQGFFLEDESKKKAQHQCFWGIVPTKGPIEQFHQNYIFTPSEYPRSDSDELTCPPKTIAVTLPCRIGRQIVPMKNVRPDAAYEIRHNPEEGAPINGERVEVTLQWKSKAGEGERLHLLKVKTLEKDSRIDPAEVEMRLNTMLEESHWLDDPTFDVELV